MNFFPRNVLLCDTTAWNEKQMSLNDFGSRLQSSPSTFLNGSFINPAANKRKVWAFTHVYDWGGGGRGHCAPLHFANVIQAKFGRIRASLIKACTNSGAGINAANVKGAYEPLP